MKKTIYLSTLFYFIVFLQNSNAYIDPGGIGAIFNILIAGLVASLIYVRSSIYSFFKNVKNLRQDIINFYKFSRNEKQIVFYCENFQYLKYFGNIIEKLSQSNLNIHLLIDKHHRELNKYNELNVYFIQSSFLKNLSLSLLKCDILILTTPDIGNSYVKKSKLCKHFFYIFHSVVSSQMVYNKFAFKNFDTVCCNGEYQIDELLEEEKKYNLRKKNLLRSGYPFFDLLKNNENKEFVEGKILVAPSWNPDIPLLYEKYYSKILNDLQKNNFEIIFRPHPEYSKRYSKNYYEFKNKFISNINIKFDTNETLQELLKSCETLITDWSGIAYEFAYLNNRGVIFNNVPLKNLNKSIISSEKIFEFKNREKIGVINDTSEDILETFKKLRKLNQDDINNFFNSNFFNLGNSSEFISESIKITLKNIR